MKIRPLALPTNITQGWKQGRREGEREKYHCTVDLLSYLFGFVCFANKNKKLSVVIQLIPKQSNRRSTVQ
jgi:hypothetical protein